MAQIFDWGFLGVLVSHQWDVAADNSCLGDNQLPALFIYAAGKTWRLFNLTHHFSKPRIVSTILDV